MINGILGAIESALFTGPKTAATSQEAVPEDELPVPQTFLKKVSQKLSDNKKEGENNG